MVILVVISQTLSVDKCQVQKHPEIAMWVCGVGKLENLSTSVRG